MITLTGDWKKAQQMMADLDKKYKQAVKRALSKCGIYLVGKLKRGVRDQKPGGKPYDKLHPFTIARKGSSKAMIDQSDFINAITYKVEDREAFVGVLKTAKNKEGQPIVNIAAVHEYGVEINVTNKMRAYLHRVGLHLKPTTKVIRIPGRPTFSPVWETEEENIIKFIEEEIQKSLFGK